jgi:hypothetical protein
MNVLAEATKGEHKRRSQLKIWQQIGSHSPSSSSEKQQTNVHSKWPEQWRQNKASV